MIEQKGVRKDGHEVEVGIVVAILAKDQNPDIVADQDIKADITVVDLQHQVEMVTYPNVL